MDARARFEELARSPDDGIDLAEAALVIASEAYPALDPGAYLERLDALAAQAASRLRGDSRERTQALCRFLHRENGFRGNREDYYDPRNSFLNDVLDRGLGIPITLALVYMEVARRLAEPVQGVGFPGHFLVKYAGDEEIVIDPFDGAILSETDCRLLLRRALGDHACFDRRYLRPATTREILVRMLRNLKHVAVAGDRLNDAVACCDRILLLWPDCAAEYRDRGVLHQRLECFRAARADLERFLALAPDDPSAGAVRDTLDAVCACARHLH
jgi:regulator of sirC expression with transglutaminase-like and TPR domain